MSYYYTWIQTNTPRRSVPQNRCSHPVRAAMRSGNFPAIIAGPGTKMQPQKGPDDTQPKALATGDADVPASEGHALKQIPSQSVTFRVGQKGTGFWATP